MGNWDKCEEKNKRMDPVSYFYMLVDKHMMIDKKSDKKFEEALEDLRCAIDNLEAGVKLNKKNEEIGELIDLWLDKFMCKYLCKEDECKCDKAIAEIRKMMEYTMKLEFQSLKLAIEAERKLEESKEMQCKIQKMAKKVAEHCYPERCEKEEKYCKVDKCEKEDKWDKCEKEDKWDKCEKEHKWDKYEKDGKRDKCEKEDKWDKCEKEDKWNKCEKEHKYDKCEKEDKWDKCEKKDKWSKCYK